jgi:hypothetical protein
LKIFSKTHRAIKSSNLLARLSNGNKDVFIGEILANMSQVSDVAPGPLDFALW